MIWSSIDDLEWNTYSASAENIDNEHIFQMRMDVSCSGIAPLFTSELIRRQ